MPEDVFGVLASPIRRQLLTLLRTDGPQPVRALAAHFDMRRPSVSEHLKVLKDAGLVVEHKRGRQRYYHLDARPLSQVEQWLRPYERFWRNKLANLREILDADNDEPDAHD
jgi:DNA-binding transcriptional ArsR family regulator